MQRRHENVGVKFKELNEDEVQTPKTALRKLEVKQAGLEDLVLPLPAPAPPCPLEEPLSWLRCSSFYCFLYRCITLIFTTLNGISLSFENQVVNTNLEEKRQHSHCWGGCQQRSWILYLRHSLASASESLQEHLKPGVRDLGNPEWCGVAPVEQSWPVAPGIWCRVCNASVHPEVSFPSTS